MLQSVSPLLSMFRARYPDLTGPIHRRRKKCGLCGATDSRFLADVDYWNLQTVQLVRCDACGLMQLDPWLESEVVAKGCTALYRFQHQGETTRSRSRGFYRAFRKGVAVGFSLKRKGIKPRRILEIGAGDGYFLKGLQYVFPEAQCTCLDIVDEILAATSEVHGFFSIRSSVEDFSVDEKNRFDLIVARDILEHLTEPGRVLENLFKALAPMGHLYFITPNGRQDAWQLFSRWQSDKAAGELLINHVNYFDPIGLQNKLFELGFTTRDFYIYDFKQFLRGAGWRLLEQHKSRRSIKKSADEVLANTPQLKESMREAIDIRPIPKAFDWLWLKPMLSFYCWIKHMAFLRAKANATVGEEIFSLAQKTRA